VEVASTGNVTRQGGQAALEYEQPATALETMLQSAAFQRLQKAIGQIVAGLSDGRRRHVHDVR
jgi:hypothetical protein